MKYGAVRKFSQTIHSSADRFKILTALSFEFDCNFGVISILLYTSVNMQSLRSFVLPPEPIRKAYGLTGVVFFLALFSINKELIRMRNDALASLFSQCLVHSLVEAYNKINSFAALTHGFFDTFQNCE